MDGQNWTVRRLGGTNGPFDENNPGYVVADQPLSEWQQTQYYINATTHQLEYRDPTRCIFTTEDEAYAAFVIAKINGVIP
jgi:hypothetical protein